MTISFYFDESGHGGDVVKSGKAFDFFDQPFFVLAAIGIEDEALLRQKLDELKSKHKIPDGELKAKSLQNKPLFAAELLGEILKEKLPLFVEVVDKRYFICMNIISCQILPLAMGFSEDPKLHFLRNTAVDFLYDVATEPLLNRFVAACVEPSDRSLTSSFESLVLFFSKSTGASQNQDIRKGVHHMILEAKKEYQTMRRTNKNAYLDFFPSPDLNKHKKQIWMLPNLSSFTNIYARINLFRNKKLADVRLLHDQQLEIDDILREAKISAEELINQQVVMFSPHSDFRFHEQASLEFLNSHESAGIQVADIIAGTVMRFYRDRQRNPEKISPEIYNAMCKLNHSSNGATGYGLNQVVPSRLVF